MSTSALPTATIAYKGYSYRLDGQPPQKVGDRGNYIYIIERAEGKPIQSDRFYGLLTEANTAARRAIDAFVAAKG